MRFAVEDMRDVGHGIVLRLPFRLGISFWGLGWRLLFGVQLSDIGMEWHLGPFGGEAWIDTDWELEYLPDTKESRP